jgi:hypothetical protein
MVAAHPDRGGTSEAFIKARESYLQVKRAVGVLRPPVSSGDEVVDPPPPVTKSKRRTK